MNLLNFIQTPLIMATKLPVEDYIDSLKLFLTGDLSVFHYASGYAEVKEANLGPIKGMTADTHSMSPSSTGSSTTGTAGTSYPESQATPPQPPLPRATIPITLALFATMDFLGFLWGTNTPGQQNTKNLEEALNKTALDQDQKDALINVYRHGMVHGFFPKLGLAVSYHSNNPQGELFFGRSGNIVLNVDEFEKIVLALLSSIPTSNYPAMDIQYQRMLKHYQTQCAPIIGRLNAKINQY
jgi:hypothetical protein